LYIHFLITQSPLIATLHYRIALANVAEPGAAVAETTPKKAPAKVSYFIAGK